MYWSGYTGVQCRPSFPRSSPCRSSRGPCRSMTLSMCSSWSYDGFRALAEIEYGRCRLISRNGNAFTSFHDLALRIGRLFPKDRVVMDGEDSLPGQTWPPAVQELTQRCGTAGECDGQTVYPLNSVLA